MLRLRRIVVLTALAGMSAVSTLPRACGQELAPRIKDLADACERQYRLRAGVCVVDMKTGKSVVQLRSKKEFIPASNQKILTSAFALKRLGANFNFTTSVYLRGGDLIIIGNFDPTLGDPAIAAAAKTSIYAELDRWAAIVKDKVGATVSGDIVLRTADSPPLRHADWPKKQHQQWYAAPVAQLNFHNNCFGVTFKVASGKAAAAVVPESYLVSVKSRVKVGRKQAWWVLYKNNDAELQLRGTVKTSASDPYPSAVNNPPMLLGRVFADRLKRAGVTLKGVVRTATAKQTSVGSAKLLASTITPLPAAMARANKRSLNMAAECIFLRAGDGTWPGSAKLMTATLAKAFDLAAGSITVHDGGGLSRNNRVTPAAMVKMLSSLAKGKEEQKAFMASLATSGQDGTMRRRLRRSPYAGRIKAKTGYITGVSALSGYILDAEGKARFAFSVLVNKVPAGKGHKAKALQDDICRLLVDSLGK